MAGKKRLIGNSRKCTTCLVEKPISQFYKKSDGYAAKCNICMPIYMKALYQKHIDHRRNQAKNYAIKHKDIISKRAKTYRENNKEERCKKTKEWRDKNIEHCRNYRKKNAEKMAITSRNSRRKRYNELKNDVMFKLRALLKSRIRSGITGKGWCKKKSSAEILGAPLEVVRKYIERQFKKGMTWENHGLNTWHIDHKIPLSTAKTEEEMITLCHYTNLQPLWAKENLEKWNKIIKPIQMKITL